MFIRIIDGCLLFQFALSNSTSTASPEQGQLVKTAQNTLLVIVSAHENRQG